MFNQIGFIGLGLIGGSIAKAARSNNLAKKIVAYDLDPLSLTLAYEEKVIDLFTSEIDENFKDCSIIFLCCPVGVNIEAYKKLIPIVNDQCIITDVGSTKENIIEAINILQMPVFFIGGHPMAGSEKVGYVASTPYLFENAYYIITPIGDFTKKDAILFEFVKALKAIPIIVSPREHDLIVGVISHVPHVIAAALVNIVNKLDSKEKHLHTLAAGGFKDITRITSSSPIMWQQITIANGNNIITILKNYMDELEQLITLIKENRKNDIYDFFNEAKNYRDSFQEKNSGVLPSSYSIAVDVVDEPGIIAKIATILAAYKINIKNIGIINNREFTEGVLEIVFYDQESLEKSIDILTTMKYIIYKR